jgi:hypothetical protein
MARAATASFAGWVMRFGGMPHACPLDAKTVFHVFAM